MKIAIVCSNFLRIPPIPTELPPGQTGASERVMHRIAEGMVKKGHDVSLYASGDSETSAKLVSVSPHSSVMDPEVGVDRHVDMEYFLLSQCYQDAKEGRFDIIHSSFDIRSAFYAPFVSTPTVATLHSPLYGLRKTILEKLHSSQWYVSISNTQREGLPSLPYAGTVYHGLDFDQYNEGSGQGEYLITVGRVHPKKGTTIAIEVAQALGKKLSIFGTHGEDEYWELCKKSIDGTHIVYTGMVEQQQIIGAYQQAKAFLFPIQWEEPFGLVMIEAMAVGTPVIVFTRGSAPEIVVDGVSGYLVNSSEDDKRGDYQVKQTGIEGLKEAVNKIYALSREEYFAMRRAARRKVAELFTIEKMIEGYEKIYQKIIDKK